MTRSKYPPARHTLPKLASYLRRPVPRLWLSNSCRQERDGAGMPAPDKRALNACLSLFCIAGGKVSSDYRGHWLRMHLIRHCRQSGHPDMEFVSSSSISPTMSDSHACWMHHLTQFCRASSANWLLLLEVHGWDEGQSKMTGATWQHSGCEVNMGFQF